MEKKRVYDTDTISLWNKREKSTHLANQPDILVGLNDTFADCFVMTILQYNISYQMKAVFAAGLVTNLSRSTMNFLLYLSRFIFFKFISHFFFLDIQNSYKNTVHMVIFYILSIRIWLDVFPFFRRFRYFWSTQIRIDPNILYQPNRTNGRCGDKFAASWIFEYWFKSHRMILGDRNSVSRKCWRKKKLMKSHVCLVCHCVDKLYTTVVNTVCHSLFWKC